MVANGQQQLLLEALDFPRRQGFDSARARAYQELVNWLENTKIRHLEMAERATLGKLGSVGWEEAFKRVSPFLIPGKVCKAQFSLSIGHVSWQMAMPV